MANDGGCSVMFGDDASGWLYLWGKPGSYHESTTARPSSKALSALERSRQWERAIQLFEDMLMQSQVPDDITWSLGKIQEKQQIR